ncbi:hypothetical protein ACEPAF_2585 [Sanghuangporus sanghuang]
MNIFGGLAENPIVALTHAYAVRYVTISGTAVLTYDTLLCFPDEVRLVWSTLLQRKYSRENAVPMKILYLISRYMMIATCIVALMSKFLITDNARYQAERQMVNNDYAPRSESAHKYSRCSNATVFTGVADIILESIASGVVFYRLYKLWEFGNRGKWILSLVFVIGKVTVWVFTFVNMAKIDHTIKYFDFVLYRGCATLLAPRLALGVWIPDALLDISLVLFFILNALSRPRLESQNLVRIIYSDGIQFFLTMICMRTINVVFTAFAPPTLFFLGTIFSGSMVTTVSSRVFLNLFRAAQDPLRPNDYYDGESISLVLTRTQSQCSRDPFLLD